MFDFAADARHEGGENGMNHKGLVTFDRKYKKDAFYAYKAWLSDEPFVHICGKRYVERVENETKVTVYSNQPEVELFVNGESLGKKRSEDHFFYYNVPNHSESALRAVAGSCTDESHIRKVDTFNEAYRMKEKGVVLNWFDITEPEGYFSLNDTIGSIMESEEGEKLMRGMFAGMAAATDQPAEAVEATIKMVSGFPVLRLMNMVASRKEGGENSGINKEQLLSLNKTLNQIRK